MKRELKGKYLLAAVITSMIFLLGMFLGVVIEGQRSNFLSDVVEQQKLSFSSLQLQYQLISEFGQQKNCLAVSSAFDGYMKQLITAQERLNKYEKDSTLNKDAFLMLKQEYTQAEINYWFLAKKTKEVCGRDITTILFFYSPEERCPDCNGQSFVLTYIKQLLKDKVLIFSFDSTLESEPLIKMLESTYNITRYPAMVINEKTYQGMYDKDALLKEICPDLKEKPEGC